MYKSQRVKGGKGMKYRVRYTIGETKVDIIEASNEKQAESKFLKQQRKFERIINFERIISIHKVRMVRRNE